MLNVIEDFHKYLADVVKKESFKYLVEQEFDGQIPLSYYYSKCKERANTEKLFDLFLCSGDIVYCLATLKGLEPYLSKKPLIPFQRRSRIDAVYCRYSSFAIEKYYNYWDRIGDLLNSHFNLLTEKAEDFPRVIDKISQLGTFDTNSDYQWLKAYKENEFQNLNKYRKKIVHYFNIESQFIHEHNPFDEIKTEDLRSEFSDLVNFLYENNDKSINGFKHTVNLIEKST